MPICLATLLCCCRSRVGALALLLALTPGLSVAAQASTELKRSDTLDMRREGTVSEDERSVLRIEWRAGLSGVEADRNIQEIMARLRQMEASVVTVNQLIRNMPSGKRVAPAAAAAPAVHSENEDSTEAGLDWRLMAANITALVLVLVWWSSRRKTQLAAAALEAEIAAKMRAEPEIAPESEPTLEFAEIQPAVATAPIEPLESAFAEAPAESPPPIVSVPPQAPIQAQASAAPPITPAPAAEIEPPPEPQPAEAPPVIDFVLEEADPATVAKTAPRPARKAAAGPSPASVSASLNKNVEPTLQLAEIMLSMGLEQGAAQALVEYTEANPRHAIHHMLKLLGIYRKRGLHKEFQETAEKLRKNFNIQAEDWGAADSGEVPTLEKFSRVSQHVQSIWGQPEECIAYLRHLLEDNREGARAGFPQSVAEEILMLVDILKETSGTAQVPG